MDVLENLTSKTDHLEEFPALPGVALKILERIKDPEAPLCQLAEVLATDPPLSAKVLMVVNSPYFGLSRRITNLPHAVNLLGEDSQVYRPEFFPDQSFREGQKVFRLRPFLEGAPDLCRGQPAHG